MRSLEHSKRPELFLDPDRWSDEFYSITKPTMKEIMEFLENYMVKNHINQIGAVEANALLSRAGLLRDSKSRPGAPLRNLLRQGKIPYAYQNGGVWIIPRNSTKKSTGATSFKEDKKKVLEKKPSGLGGTELARKRFKPQKIKYLLIAEAPPEALDRFFYYESVEKHDDLFLGIMGVLYPDSKLTYIETGRPQDQKTGMLKRFMNDGFYLLDLSEVPLSNRVSLSSCVDSLMERVIKVVDSDTKIILIKTNVFDLIYDTLRSQLRNRVMNLRIPFPGSGQQKKFVSQFREALSNAGYFK